MARKGDYNLELWNIIPEGVDNGAEALRIQTNRGIIIARLHSAASEKAVIWVGGAGGGLDGPAGGMYPRLAQILVSDEITSLRLHYRYPNDLEECVLDTLLGVEFLKNRGKTKI